MLGRKWFHFDMSGPINILDSVAGITETTVSNLVLSQLGHAVLSFLADISAISTNWSIEIAYMTPSGKIVLAKKTGIASTGLYLIPIESSLASKDALPEPNQITYTRTGAAGNLTAEVRSIYGD